jgi:hypothetical protein
MKRFEYEGVQKLFEFINGGRTENGAQSPQNTRFNQKEKYV